MVPVAGHLPGAPRIALDTGRRASHASMNSFGTTTIIFACSFGAGLVGMLLHVKLPDHHLDAGSKDVVKLVMSLIATMAALVLSLLIASGSSSYQAQENEVQSLCGERHVA